MVRGRKPAVNYEKRHEWLDRNRRGESPPSIANTDGFDVRTVRKNIDLARHEAESGEARTMVYRDALENHYADLCRLAAKLDSAVTAKERVNEIMHERLYKALKQHLPVSKLWRSFDRWNILLEDREKDRKSLEDCLGKETANNTEIKKTFTGRIAVVDGISQALLFQANQWVKGMAGLDVKRDVHLEPTGGNNNIGRYGSFRLGPITEEELPLIQKIIEHLESEVVTWDQYAVLRKLETEIRDLKADLLDDLAIITLKRIVPGSCRYCPD